MTTILKTLNLYICEWFNRFSESLNKEMLEIVGEDGDMNKNEEGCDDNGKSYRQGEEWTDPGECNHKVCHRRGVISVRKSVDSVPNGSSSPRVDKYSYTANTTPTRTAALRSSAVLDKSTDQNHALLPGQQH